MSLVGDAARRFAALEGVGRVERASEAQQAAGRVEWHRESSGALLFSVFWSPSVRRALLMVRGTRFPPKNLATPVCESSRAWWITAGPAAPAQVGHDPSLQPFVLI